MKNKRMMVNELDIRKHLKKDNHAIDRCLADSSYSLDRVLSFPKKASKKDITKWLVKNGYEEYSSNPFYEYDYSYCGGAGSKYGSEIIRRGNKVYIFSRYDI